MTLKDKKQIILDKLSYGLIDKTFCNMTAINRNIISILNTFTSCKITFSGSNTNDNIQHLIYTATIDKYIIYILYVDYDILNKKVIKISLK